MKKILLVLSFQILLIGCTTHGFGTAGHNGKLYYFPEGCETYAYSYQVPDALHCKHNGNLTGQILQPADAQQRANHKYQNERSQQSYKNLRETLKDMTPKTTHTRCYNYGVTIDCNSTTY